MTPDDARRKLRKDLAASGVDLKAASLAIGRNHAYLQQFVERGTPAFLGERDRERLSTLYPIDARSLKPPDLDASGSQIAANTRPRPRAGDPINDIREAAIIETWRQLSKEQQDTVIGMLNGFRFARGLPAVAV